MKDKFLIILKCIVFLSVVLILYMTARDINNIGISRENANLIIYGDAISNEYKPFVENGKIYLSFNTIWQFIDEDIFFDEETQKIIVTTEDSLYKFTIDENIATKNLEEYDAKSCAKKVNGKVYIDMNLLKDIYDIKCEFNAETNLISIDKLDTRDINLNYNQVKLYSKINTNSEILETLNKNNTVIVYTDSLEHNRWYKVKSDSGKIGYIEKSAVTLKDDNEDNEDDQKVKSKKLIMFWQYGSNLDTLGEKIEGVNVAMPTWYALSDDLGNIEINYNEEYYNKAKEYGYELWPIITNGIDNPNLDRKQITSEIMNDEKKRETLIRNIISLIETNNLDGINIDFEGMLVEDKNMYTQFLRELYPMVKETGAKLSVDIYFTNYIDRKAVGKACDYVMLMGYDQRGDWSEEPGSISDISWVENNINSLINDSKIPSSKIILGVPFYTRMWNINEDGSITTDVYTMNDTNEFLKKYNLTPTMDNISGHNYIEVELNNIRHKLWIEDADSISSRADIVLEYDLAGITAWRKGFETPDIWELLKNKLK